MHRLRLLVLMGALGASACGSATISSTPAAAPVPVNVVLFYDENGNGALDAGESVRLPNATITAGAITAHTDAGGRATLSLVPGTQTITVDASSLPPYYQTKAVTLNVPASGDVALAATLSIGSNLPNHYMAFGDSLTSDLGYPDLLERQLGAYFGTARVTNRGSAGTKSGRGLNNGAFRMKSDVAEETPAFTLILYGTNDWNDCHNPTPETPCFTIDSLDSMIKDAQGAGSLVFLGTIPPVNVGAKQAPPERQQWVHDMDVYVRNLAIIDGVALVDVEKEFLAQPDLPSLFQEGNDVHFNANGTQVLVDAFFKGITTRQS